MMTFSPALGLFFYSPWLLLFVPALFRIHRTAAPQRLLVYGAAAASLTLPLTISSHEYWIGGAILGPRYLVAALPFFLFPIAALMGHSRGGKGWVLPACLTAGAAVSILLISLILAAVPYVNTSPEYLDQNPVSAYAYPLLASGRSTMTVANYFGAGFFLSNALFVVLVLGTVSGYVLPWLLGAGARARLVALGSGFVGAVLFLVWYQIGSDDNPFIKRQRNVRLQIMDLRDQPRSDEGAIVFLKRAAACSPVPVNTKVTAFDPAIEGIVQPDPTFYKIADGFKFIKSPIWAPEGYLLFSDTINNTIYKWTPQGELSVFMDFSGCGGADAAKHHRPGSNGLALDREGRLVIAQYGSRRVARREKDGTVTVLADRYGGIQLNIPSDVAFRSDGALYFTDTSFGLTFAEKDSEGHWVGASRRRWLPYCGIYRLADGNLRLAVKARFMPVGLAFSPDEQYLYTYEWNRMRKFLVRFKVNGDGTLTEGTPFHDLPSTPLSESQDGLEVDRKGNIYTCARDGILVFSPEGKKLGLIKTPGIPLSFTFGGEEDRTLFIGTITTLYRLRMRIQGKRR